MIMNDYLGKSIGHELDRSREQRLEDTHLYRLVFDIVTKCQPKELSQKIAAEMMEGGKLHKFDPTDIEGMVQLVKTNEYGTTIFGEEIDDSIN